MSPLSAESASEVEEIFISDSDEEAENECEDQNIEPYDETDKESTDNGSSTDGGGEPEPPSRTTSDGSVCLFCGRSGDDEGGVVGRLCHGSVNKLKRGRPAAWGKKRRHASNAVKLSLTVHELCLMLASGLPSNSGDREDSLMGFSSQDVLKEAARASKLNCNYCSKKGATIGCSVPSCKYKFHLPCGRENGSFHLFYENFRSYCREHIPSMSDTSGSSALLSKRPRACSRFVARTTCSVCQTGKVPMQAQGGMVVRTNCCQMDNGTPFYRYYHYECVSSLALTAGHYHFKCPSSSTTDRKDKHSRRFREQALLQGIHVPKRDAAWETEMTADEERRRREGGDSSATAPFCCLGESCLCPDGFRHVQRFPDVWHLLDACPTCAGNYVHRQCAGRPWSDRDVETVLVEESVWQCPTCSNVPSA